MSTPADDASGHAEALVWAPWYRPWLRCRAVREPRALLFPGTSFALRSDHHGRCELVRHSDHVDHAIVRAGQLFRWSTAWTFDPDAVPTCGIPGPPSLVGDHTIGPCVLSPGHMLTWHQDRRGARWQARYEWQAIHTDLPSDPTDVRTMRTVGEAWHARGAGRKAETGDAEGQAQERPRTQAGPETGEAEVTAALPAVEPAPAPCRCSSRMEAAACVNADRCAPRWRGLPW